MAGSGLGWMKALAVAVLLIGVEGRCLAQSTPSGPAGSLSGKLTDLHSRPLEGVTVVLRNQATGAETQTTSAKNGVYRFTGLEPGEYSLQAESPQLGRGQVEGIVVNADCEARVQVALLFQPLPASPMLTAAQIQNRLAPTAPHPEPETLPVDAAGLAVEPMRTLPLSRRPENAEIPSTPERNAALPAEPLQTQALPEHASADSVPARAGTNGPPVSESRPGAPAVPSGTVQASPLPIDAIIAPALAAPKTTQAATSATQATVPNAQTPPKPVPALPQRSDPVSPAVTTTMSAAELQALPVNGRHWQDFVLDNIPTSVTPEGGAGQISLMGAGQQPTEITVDGMSQGLAYGPTGESGQGSSGRGALGQGEHPVGMAQVGAGGHGLAMSEAAIRAVQTVAGNVEAAAARASGGRMNVETQSGGNHLHGQGFVFDRQNTWGARNPFTQWVKETSPATGSTVPVFTSQSYTPPDRATTWGIGVGGRIRRNKLFWFAAYDGYQRNNAALSTVKHPSLCANTACTQQTGFFAQPSNDQMQVLSARLGLSSTNAIAEGLAVYSGMLENLAGLLGPTPRTARQWTGFTRLDWQVAERHRFTLEAIGAGWNSPGGGLPRVSESFGNHSFGQSRASEDWLLGRWETFLTPNLLAATQASVGRAIQSVRPQTPSALEQTFLAGNAWGQLPQIVVDNRYGFTIGNPSRFGTGSYPDERLYHAKESLDWIRGKLLVKAGFEVTHNSDMTSQLRNQTGTYTYSNVENFISDALAFQKFGISGALDPVNQHTCDQTGKAAWRDSANNLRGLGSLPCYSYYSQSIGPTDWHLSTNDWAGYATAQWEPNKRLVASAGLRWEREQLPPPLAALQNTDLPLTAKLPSLGNNWALRVSMAVGTGQHHWPVLRLGYGMYFGRTTNQTVETALTQTGSTAGILNFFVRPTDGFNPPTGTSNAQPFPYVLQGQPTSIVKPGAVEFAPDFHNPEVHQAVAAVEEKLPSHIAVTASAMVSLGRRLPISIDTNLDPPTPTQTITYAVVDTTGAGPIKAARITVPFYASWPSAAGSTGRPFPDYQQITNIESRANSTYEAAMLKMDRYGRHGLSLHAHYTYAHAMDWNPNESSQIAGNDVLDPTNFGLEYGVSNLDIRHAAGVTAIYEAPWKLHGMAGKLGNRWMLSGVGHFRGGMPYTMRTSGSLAREFTNTGAAIVGLGPGMNGSGGDNRVYGVGSDNVVYNIGRNTFRYPATWKADLRLGRRFDLGKMRQLELLAESFNLFNHQNVTQLETTGYFIQSGSTSSLPTLNFLTGPVTQASGKILNPTSTAFGQPLNVNATNFYRERQIQFGLRMRF